jgi:hypothetical protein
MGLRSRAVDGRGAPLCSARRRNAVSVQADGDCARRGPIIILGENPPDDGGFRLIDTAVAIFDGPIVSH